jgi:integrase
MGRHYHTAPKLHRTDELRTGVYPDKPVSGAWWYIRPTWPGQHKPGARISLGYVSATSKRQAEKARTEKLAAINRAPITAAAHTPFAEFAELYETQFLVHKSPSTQACYRSVIRKQLTPHFGRARLCNIHRMDVQRWITGLDATRNRRKFVLSVFASMFEWGIRFGYYAESNPARYIELGAEELRVEEPVAYTREQVRNLLAALPEPKRIISEVMFFTGLRAGEALGLTPAALIEPGRLFIFQVYDSQLCAIKPLTKNKKSNLVACPALLWEKLRRIAVGKGKYERLWTVNYLPLYNAIKAAERTLGYESYRSGAHTARRTFVTQFRQETGTLPTAQLGHSSEAVTEIYNRPTPDAQAAEVERLWAEVWGGEVKGGVQ